MKPTNFIFISTAIYLILSFCSCTKSEASDNEKCGDIITWQSNVLDHYVTSGTNNDSNYIDLFYEDLTEPQDICTAVSVDISYDIETNNSVGTLNNLLNIYFNYKLYANLTYKNQGFISNTNDKDFF